MIELAEADLRAAGITDVDLRVMDAEHLDSPMRGSTYSPLPLRCSSSLTPRVRPPSSGGCSGRAVSSRCRPGGTRTSAGASRTTSSRPRTRRGAGPCSSPSTAPRTSRSCSHGRLHRPPGAPGGDRDPLRVQAAVVGLALVVQRARTPGAAGAGGRGRLPRRVLPGDGCPRAGDGYPLRLTALIVIGRRSGNPWHPIGKSYPP